MYIGSNPDRFYVPEAGLNWEDAIARKDEDAVRHLFPYYWASEFTAGDGKLTADLSCGCGYGSRILAEPLGDELPRVLGIDHRPRAIGIALAQPVALNLRFVLTSPQPGALPTALDPVGCLVNMDGDLGAAIMPHYMETIAHVLADQKSVFITKAAPYPDCLRFLRRYFVWVLTVTSDEGGFSMFSPMRSMREQLHKAGWMKPEEIDKLGADLIYCSGVIK